MINLKCSVMRRSGPSSNQSALTERVMTCSSIISQRNNRKFNEHIKIISWFSSNKRRSRASGWLSGIDWFGLISDSERRNLNILTWICWESADRNSHSFTHSFTHSTLKSTSMKVNSSNESLKDHSAAKWISEGL